MMENCYENICSCGRIYYGDKLQPFCAYCYDIKLRTAEQERDQYKAELVECSRIIEQLQATEHQKHLELESLRAKIKEAQEPIYMWRLEDDGWMECTKEWFDAAISSGYEKRIVYAKPVIPD